ncbi:adenylosuccinate lyase [Candidatus Uhrbacteria bacterium]|nr:adenylosuccinate lyase [Candidatus Uhrbacteria bacterium]
MHPLEAISPLDGRYQEKLQQLAAFFSEMGLMRYRVRVEVEYLIALSATKAVAELKPLTPKETRLVRDLYEQFTLTDAQRIKEIESTTKHDVKAIEYFLKEKLHNTPVESRREFIHFALTSEDVNNIAYSLMWQDAKQAVYLSALQSVIKKLHEFAWAHRAQPMLSLTHGQSATPTTVGKEFMVFVERLQRQLDQLDRHALLGKFSGATGTWGAQSVALPKFDWKKFSKAFIVSLQLQPNVITTQIEPHDSIAEEYHMMSRVNTILIDFCRDLWMYISRGIFAQQRKAGEVGSSAMPHKINPIFFENAEGNCGLANAILTHLAEKLPISRMQRDLTDSTVLRNQGVAMGYSVLALQNIINAMSRVAINPSALHQELDAHWEVLAEPIQTVLRAKGFNHPYEMLKELTRGEVIDRTTLHAFIAKLKLPKKDEKRLLQLTPMNYTGLAATLVTKP